jgi:hypothetical protein
VSGLDVEDLLSCFDEDTLVVGAALDGHDFMTSEKKEVKVYESESEGEGREGCRVVLRGRTCPWNTCAMWRLDKLGVMGFPLIGDGITLKASGGGGRNGKGQQRKREKGEEEEGGGLEDIVIAGGVEVRSSVCTCLT